MDEGSNCNIVFNVTCDPPLDSNVHTLTKDGSENCKGRISILPDRCSIQIDEVNSEDAGDYVVTSCNAVGEGSGSIHVRVIGKFIFLA